MNSRKLTNPSDKKTVRDALTREQVHDIIGQLHKLEEKDRKLMALLLLTGMRRGEVLGLRWEDVRWAEKKIYVERNITFANNQPHIGTPKTEKGKRKIPLDPQLKELLQPVQSMGYIIGEEQPVSHMM